MYQLNPIPTLSKFKCSGTPYIRFIRLCEQCKAETIPDDITRPAPTTSRYVNSEYLYVEPTSSGIQTRCYLCDKRAKFTVTQYLINVPIIPFS